MVKSIMMYIERKKSMGYIENKLVDQFEVSLGFKNKKERIFKNEEMLITCKDKYITILVYDDIYERKARNIADLIS